MSLLSNDGHLYYLSQQEQDAIPTFFEREPIKLELDTFTKLTRTMLRGLFEPYLLNQQFSFHIFGTTDHINWQYITGFDKIGRSNDSILGHNSYSCKTYIIIFRKVLTLSS